MKILQFSYALLQITNFGGYGIAEQGIYLDLVPSLSQFTTGLVPFYAVTDDSMFMVI